MKLALRHPAALLLLALAAALAPSGGCGGAASEDEPCQSNDDCGDNIECFAGYCRTYCEIDAHCSSNACFSLGYFGVCLRAPEASCTSDAQCAFPGGGKCWAGICHAPCAASCLGSQQCVDGACVDEQAVDAHCKGACGTRTCGPAPDPACPGTTCGSCSGEDVCSNAGACGPLDPAASWIVASTSGTVKDNGIMWDSLCASSTCLPDPFLTVDGQATSKPQDTLAPVWNQDMVTKSAADLMASGVSVTYFDDDIPYSTDDVICSTQTVTFTAADFAAGTKHVECDNGSYDFALRAAP
jgi:hypothetical protein